MLHHQHGNGRRQSNDYISQATFLKTTDGEIQQWCRCFDVGYACEKTGQYCNGLLMLPINAVQATSGLFLTCVHPALLYQIDIKRGYTMIKVKTFTNELKPLHTMNELMDLDEQVNRFLETSRVKKVISVSDACTSGDGHTIGIVRVVTYETA